ncbi:MAG TPA: alkaline phosphatase [Bacteroidetes bacterium]|nr:alkaline phosphatase [Bacteroidota bacterium]
MEPAEKAKNIVLLIGDGVGIGQITSALYNRDRMLQVEYFPFVGFQKPFSANNLITDSAASATAMACGAKTRNNIVGMDADGKALPSILEIAEKKGLSTGLVTTSSIVHATPAAFIAHQKSRQLYEHIAADFLKTDIDLFIGGGKKYFDHRKTDDRDLIRELEKKNYLIFDYFNHNLQQIKPNPRKNFAWFTAYDQPLPASQGRDYLPAAADMALRYLDERSDVGFFIMIEAAQTDWACHANQGGSLLAEMDDFDKTIKKVLNFARHDGQTLVIVTSDHETGGLAVNPGSKRRNIKMAFTTNGHTGTMVPVFAYGPAASLFEGIYDNTRIFEKMTEAFGW